MNEAEWLTCQDPYPMLQCLADKKVSERKSRLFAVACCLILLRKVRVHPWAERGVLVAERYADGAATLAELEEAHGSPRTSDWRSKCASEGVNGQLALEEYTSRASRTAMHGCWNAAETECGTVVADCAACNAAWALAEHEAEPPDDNGLSSVFNARLKVEQVTQCGLLRCIIGNPFRASPITSAVLAWQGCTVVKMAEAVYEGRRWEDMPLLGDALEDAGCTDQALLDHCRGPGPHARGCYLLDILLDKS